MNSFMWVIAVIVWVVVWAVGVYSHDSHMQIVGMIGAFGSMIMSKLEDMDQR